MRIVEVERRVVERAAAVTPPSPPLTVRQQAPPTPERPAGVLRAPAQAAPAALVARARALAPPADVLRAPAPPAPVQISIGRVEVRAPKPAAESRRPAAPRGPRLSLDAYLNGRNGGGR